jgi:hypothetical protein
VLRPFSISLSALIVAAAEVSWLFLLKFQWVRDKCSFMRASKWVILSVCLAAAALFIVNNIISNHKIKKAHSPAPPFVQQPDASGTRPSSRAPRYITVRMKKPLRTLIAGETDSFELEARLMTPENYSEKTPLWDRATFCASTALVRPSQNSLEISA